MTNFHKKGALPCASEYSCISSKYIVLKAFLISRCIVNIPVKGQLCIKEKQKRYFVRKFLKPYGPVCVLVKRVDSSWANGANFNK